MWMLTDTDGAEVSVRFDTDEGKIIVSVDNKDAYENRQAAVFLSKEDARRLVEKLKELADVDA